MENINLAIVTRDREYGNALGYGIISVCRTIIVNVFSPEEFTGKRSMYVFDGEEPAGFDLVLWDGQPEIRGRNIVMMVDKPSMACRNAAGDNFRIYKYSPAQQMISDIFDIYGRVTGRSPVNVSPAGVHVYAFCSSAGGTGCSTVAMAFCQELKRFHDRRVIYVSLEELESTGGFIKAAASAGSMAHYLYSLFRDKKSVIGMVGEEKVRYRPFMESFTISDDFGVEAFRPTKGRNPLVDLDPEEICMFIESVMSSGRYDAVVIDTGAGLSPAALTCLEMAERACLVSTENADALRETNYLQYLMAVCGEDMLHKMIKVENMVRSEKYHDFFAEEKDGKNMDLLDTEVVLERDNICSEEGSIKKVLLEGNFGNNISKLANKFIEPLGSYDTIN